MNLPCDENFILKCLKKILMKDFWDFSNIIYQVYQRGYAYGLYSGDVPWILNILWDIDVQKHRIFSKLYISPKSDQILFKYFFLSLNMKLLTHDVYFKCLL